jgi:hypothetical protein
LYLQLGYQTPEDVLGLNDQTTDPSEETTDEPKRPPGADGFM